MDWYIYAALVVAGIIAGFINTLAGSGSLLTLPLLMFIGLPPTVANATNRIGVLFQSAVSSASFRHQRVFEFKREPLVCATFSSRICHRGSNCIRVQ